MKTKTYSYNELRAFFIEVRGEDKLSFLPLDRSFNPDEKLYTDFQFRKLKDFFLRACLDNFFCKRINCYNVNPDHVHSSPETQEEYLEKIISLLEEWKESNSEAPTDPKRLEIHQREMSKLSQIIAFCKERHDFEKQVAKLNEYFDNSSINNFSKSSQLFELEERCKKLLEKKDLKEENKQDNWAKKFLSAPLAWFSLFVVLIVVVFLFFYKSRYR